MRMPLRCLAWATLFLLPACVIRLTDRNAPEANGGVTGPPADCSTVQPEPGGIAEGEVTEKMIGRFVALDETTPEGQPVYRFDWSGSYISTRFTGTDQVTVRLQLTTVEMAGVQVPQDQIFEFVIDGKPSKVQITVKPGPDGLPSNVPHEEYPITGLDPNVPHELVVYKNTEAQKGSILYKGIDLHGGQRLPPVRRKRRMEFIGDSITCGYGNEGANATCPFEVKVREARNDNGEILRRPDNQPYVVTVPLTERQYFAYTAIAARALDADAVTICWSGKGVYLNYKDRFIRADDGSVQPDPDNPVTMVDLWEKRTIAQDPGIEWDFANEDDVPDVVVINLGTNDFSRDSIPDEKARQDPDILAGDNVPDRILEQPQELENFYNAYKQLVLKVRQHRPQAHIFLATPPMLTDQFPLLNARTIVRNVLRRIASEVDDKVYQMDLVEQGFRYGLGCDYHPNLEVHRIMAEQLIGAVRSKTCW